MSAAFLAGFALALILSAAPHLFLVRLGVDPVHTVLATLAMAPGLALGARIRPRRWTALILPALCLAAPAWISALGSWLAPRLPLDARDPRHALRLLAFAAAALSPLAIAVGPHARAAGRGRLAAVLLGFAAGLASFATLGARVAGVAGSIRLAGVLALAALALAWPAWIAPRGREEPDARPHRGRIRLAPLLLAGLIGPLCARLDLALGETLGAAQAGPAIAFLGAAGGFALGRGIPSLDRIRWIGLAIALAVALPAALAETRAPGAAAALGLIVAAAWIGASAAAVAPGPMLILAGALALLAHLLTAGGASIETRSDPHRDDRFSRAAGFALALAADPPKLCLVLGEGGLPIARELRGAGAGDVVWVTPSRADADAAAGDPHLHATCAAERAFLQHTRQEFDVAVLAPIAGSPRRFAFTHTAELRALLLARLAPRGICVQMVDASRLDPVQLFRSVLPTTAFPDWVLFLAHPLDPRPLLLRVSGREPLRFDPARIQRRIDALALSRLEREGLDLRGVLACALLDSTVFEIAYSETWVNDDERPRLALEPFPRDEMEPAVRSHVLLALQERHVAVNGRLDFGDDLPREGTALDGMVRSDFEAVRALLGLAIARLARGDDAFEADSPASSDADVEALLAAAAESPGLELARRPVLERARREPDAALRLLGRLRDFAPAEEAPALAIARLHLRSGRPRAAEAEYRRALSFDSERPIVEVELGLLLAGGGAERRAEAADRLHHAAEIGTLPEPLRAKAEWVLAHLDRTSTTSADPQPDALVRWMLEWRR